MNTAAETAIHREVAAARAGHHPRLVGRMGSGWLIFGERQFVDGYLLLLPDPVVPTLNALAGKERVQFLLDMGRAGDALLSLTRAVRINYAILGNVEPVLHAHLIPRYAHEPDELRLQHPWAYDWSKGPLFDPQCQQGLLAGLRRELV